jgi:hypothetical protein
VGTLRRFQRRRRFGHYGLECFGSPRDDMPVHKLPADALLNEKFIEGFRKLWRIRFPLLKVVFGQPGRQRFNEVVDPEPSHLYIRLCTSSQMFGYSLQLPASGGTCSTRHKILRSEEGPYPSSTGV